MDEQVMNRLPGEVVEVYRQPLSGEVVELYSRPLPGASRQAAKPSPPPEQAKKRHSKKGLWIFLGPGRGPGGRRRPLELVRCPHPPNRPL